MLKKYILCLAYLFSSYSLIAEDLQGQEQEQEQYVQQPKLNFLSAEECEYFLANLSDEEKVLVQNAITEIQKALGQACETEAVKILEDLFKKYRYGAVLSLAIYLHFLNEEDDCEEECEMNYSDVMETEDEIEIEVLG